jgi:hypothetical protein
VLELTEPGNVAVVSLGVKKQNKARVAKGYVRPKDRMMQFSFSKMFLYRFFDVFLKDNCI